MSYYGIEVILDVQPGNCHRFSYCSGSVIGH